MGPSTDAVSALNHETVVGGFARAYDVHGIEVPDWQVIIIKQLMGGGKLVWINLRMIHAAGTDPRGLGMMQLEGRPQQSKLKMQKDTCRRDMPVRLRYDAARGAAPAE